MRGDLDHFRVVEKRPGQGIPPRPAETMVVAVVSRWVRLIFRWGWRCRCSLGGGLGRFCLAMPLGDLSKLGRVHMVDDSIQVVDCAGGLACIIFCGLSTLSCHQSTCGSVNLVTREVGSHVKHRWEGYSDVALASPAPSLELQGQNFRQANERARLGARIFLTTLWASVPVQGLCL